MPNDDTMNDILTDKTTDGFAKLRGLIKVLRGPNGCPWDREQTLESLKFDIVGEALEATNAIELNDYDGLKEELGDVIWGVLMQAQMAEDNGLFTIDDSLQLACEKLVRRHPHVFGHAKASSSAEAIELFYKAKAEEKRAKVKLVRDKIPELKIPGLNSNPEKNKLESEKNDGYSDRYKVTLLNVSDDEKKKYAELKLREEFFEYLESGNIEELADIIEVCYLLARLKGVSKEEFEKIRAEKNAKKGAFDNLTVADFSANRR